MRIIFIMLVFFIALPNLIKALNEVSYSFALIDNNTLEVTTEFKSDKSGSTFFLNFYKDYGDKGVEKKPYQVINAKLKQNIVTDNFYNVKFSEPVNILEISHKANEAIQIKYFIKQGTFNYIARKESVISIKGDNLIYPVSTDNSAVKINFNWKGLGKGFNYFQTKFNDTVYSFAGSSIAFKSKINTFSTPYFLFTNGKNIYQKKFLKQGSKEYILTLVNYGKKDATLVEDKVKKIISFQALFFQNSEFKDEGNNKIHEDFIIIRNKLSDKEAYGHHIPALHSSVIFHKNINNLNSLANVVSHEYLHRIFSPNRLNIVDDKLHTEWFYEGFTYYFASLLNYKAGVIDKSRFVKEINHYMANLQLISKGIVKGSTSFNEVSMRGVAVALQLEEELAKLSRKKVELIDLLKGIVRSCKRKYPCLFTIDNLEEICGKSIKRGKCSFKNKMYNYLDTKNGNLAIKNYSLNISDFNFK